MKWTPHTYVMPSHPDVVTPGYVSPSMRWHIRRSHGVAWVAVWVPIRLSLGGLVTASSAYVRDTLELVDEHMGPVTPGEALLTRDEALTLLVPALDYALSCGAAAVDATALGYARRKLAGMATT